LIRWAKSIPTPRDYFQGKQRSAEVLPDQVLLFTRRLGSELLSTSTGSAFHQRWVLIVALSGEGTVELDRVPTRLKPGSALLVPPLHLHGYEGVARHPLWLFVTFEWPAHTALAEAWHGARIVDGVSWNRLCEFVKTACDRKVEGDVVAAHLLVVLRRLFPLTSSSRSKINRDQRGLVASVREAALTDPGGKLRAIAARVGISESHLRARFRTEAGISLGRYLREARLRQSLTWLREEGLSVKEVAERACYPDIYSFSHAFRRTLGLSPTEARRREPILKPTRFRTSRPK